MEEVSNLWRLWWIIGYQTGCGIWFCKNILATHKALKFKQSVRWILDNSHISRSQPKSFLETHFLFFSLPVLEDCYGDNRVSDIWFFGKYLSITLSTHNAFKSYNLISRWHWLWHLRHWLHSDNWEHVSYELVAPYSEGGVNYISTAAGKLNLIRVHRTKVIFLVQHKLTDCLCWLFNIGFYRTQVYLGSDLWVRVFKTNRPLWNLTELTLADEDTNSIRTDGNVFTKLCFNNWCMCLQSAMYNVMGLSC